jgi:hypothetical protein
MLADRVRAILSPYRFDVREVDALNYRHFDIRTKMAVVQLRQRNRPGREENGGNSACPRAPVVRTNGGEGPNSAPFRPAPRQG